MIAPQSFSPFDGPACSICPAIDDVAGASRSPDCRRTADGSRASRAARGVPRERSASRGVPTGSGDRNEASGDDEGGRTSVSRRARPLVAEEVGVCLWALEALADTLLMAAITCLHRRGRRRRDEHVRDRTARPTDPGWSCLCHGRATREDHWLLGRTGGDDTCLGLHRPQSRETVTRQASR